MYFELGRNLYTRYTPEPTIMIMTINGLISVLQLLRCQVYSLGISFRMIARRTISVTRHVCRVSLSTWSARLTRIIMLCHESWRE